MNSKLNKSGFLFLLTCLIYANTLSLDFALDDALVITQNSFTKKGIDGIGEIFSNEFFTGFFGQKKELVAGGRYRPFSLAMFAIEYEIFGKSPLIGHLINVLLYALSVVVIYKLLQKLLLTYETNDWFCDIPFFAALVFACHPIHTEVVANIKGRDELLTLFASISSLYLIILFNLSTGFRKGLFWILSFFTFSIGLFSKENAISYLVVIPTALFYFKNYKGKQILYSLTPLLLASMFFLYIRSQVLGGFGSVVPDELMNDPFLGTTAIEKYSTVFYTWFVYAKLIVFPHPLTYDYYPYHIGIAKPFDFKVWIGFLLYFGIAIYAFIQFIKSLTSNSNFTEKKKLYIWSAIIFFSSFSIISNLLFPIGAFMNERFLYMPSVGIALATAILVSNLIKLKYGRYIKFLVIAVLISFIGKTIHRNFAWQDDFTLFTTDVQTSFNSAKSTCSAGGKLLERAKDPIYIEKRDEYLQLSLKYLNQSITIYPEYVEALLLLGNCHFEFEQYDSTIYYYKKLVERAPGHTKVYDNLQVVLNKITDIDKQLEICKAFHKVNSVNYDLNYKLGVIYGKHKGDLNQSIFYLERAVKIDKTKKAALKDLGVAYGIANRPQDAERILKLAIQADPNDGQTYLNLGITYQNLKRMDEAALMFSKAVELDPTLRK